MKILKIKRVIYGEDETPKDLREYKSNYGSSVGTLKDWLKFAKERKIEYIELSDKDLVERFVVKSSEMIDNSFFDIMEDEVDNNGFDGNTNGFKVISGEYFNSEFNYNNADKTSGQKCYEDIEKVEEIFKEVFNFLCCHDERCDVCAHKLDDEDFNNVSEDRGEFWGAPCSENICIGYTCPNCENKEEW